MGAASTSPERNLLFGLLALQVGLINQGQLVAAFQAWNLEKARQLADHLIVRGDLDADQRAVIDAMVGLHLKKHDGDVERSLAAIPAGRAACESLARVGGAQIEASLARVGTAGAAGGDVEDESTIAHSVGSATSDGVRFRVLRPHARGGLGAVFVALDAELNREVALKQILDAHADDPESRDRFVLEAEITGGLEHPGIVPVYGLGTYGDGRPFYAMRFIRGESLKHAIGHFHGDETLKKDPGRRSLELRKLLHAFTDVCNAIEYAHSRGVLHRDIKPANVILGKHGETLVVDWGLAKATGKSDPASGERTLLPGASHLSSETLPGSALGTPAYMSPEQARGDFERLGRQSDVYSLGAVLYCLLTGKPPQAGDVVDVLRAVQTGDLRPPRALDPTIDRALEAVCLKAMALEPADRYATPRALAGDVERWMADERVTAWREPVSRRARRWGRRNRAAVSALAAAVLVALAGTASVLAVQTKANFDLTAANIDLAVASAQVRRSNADLEASYGRERERFDLAMSAIKLFHGNVSEDLLLKERKFDGLRTKLLRGAAGFYGKLEGLLARLSDPKSRAALAAAYDELAGLTGNIGNKQEALAVYQKAIAVRWELASRDSSDAEATLDLARSLLAAGSLQRDTGDLAGAMAAYEEARGLAELLGATERAPEQVQAVLGKAHVRIGRLLGENMGKQDEALESLEKSLSIRQKLADANPSVTEYQSDLTATLNQIGVALASQDKPAEALKWYEKARAIGQKLADTNPLVTEFQSNLAFIWNNVGIALEKMGKPAEALAAYDRAQAITQKLVVANPSITEFQRVLAMSEGYIGDLLTRMGKRSSALEAYERVRVILQKLADANPSVTEFQRLLADAVLRVGSFRQADGHADEAVEAYRKALAMWEKISSPTRFDHYNAACAHARLAGIAVLPGSSFSAKEGVAEADRAMTSLREAVGLGFRDLAVMRTDSDLDPLRSRPDFQLLLMDVAMPAEPFAP